MSVIDRGTGTPVLLVHGSLADSRFWLPQIESVSAEFRVIAPSLRHHYPGRWAGGPHSVEVHADDLALLAAELGLGPFHLLGHSRGGAVAMRFALRHPERLRSLTLIDPALTWTDEPQHGSSLSSIHADGDDAFVAAFIDASSGPGTWARLKPVRRAFALDNASSLRAQAREPADPIDPAALDELTVDCLLIDGERSPARYKRPAERLGHLLPRARRWTVPGAGHAPSAERPAAFNAAAIEFWQSCDQIGLSPARERDCRLTK